VNALLFALAAAAFGAVAEPTPQLPSEEAASVIARLAPAEEPPGRVLRAVEDHLRDDFACLPPPALVFEGPFPLGTFRPRGSIEYLKWVRGFYSYEIAADAASVVVTVRVRFLGEQGGPVPAADLRTIAATLEQAAALWNDGAPPPLKGRLRFRFEPALLPRDAMYSVRLTHEDVRSLYYYRWRVDSSAEAVAHEVGHMLGLNDEYDIVRNRSGRCPAGSLMCESSFGKPYPYHYYLILRRAFCRPS
jgi:hypothetical protein